MAAHSLYRQPWDCLAVGKGAVGSVVMKLGRLIADANSLAYIYRRCPMSIYFIRFEGEWQIPTRMGPWIELREKSKVVPLISAPIGFGSPGVGIMG